jgi:hypothetical protein
LLTREQLLGLGLASTEISQAHKAGLLKRLGPGVSRGCARRIRGDGPCASRDCGCPRRW